MFVFFSFYAPRWSLTDAVSIMPEDLPAVVANGGSYHTRSSGPVNVDWARIGILWLCTPPFTRCRPALNIDNWPAAVVTSSAWSLVKLANELFTIFRLAAGQCFRPRDRQIDVHTLSCLHISLFRCLRLLLCFRDVVSELHSIFCSQYCRRASQLFYTTSISISHRSTSVQVSLVDAHLRPPRTSASLASSWRPAKLPRTAGLPVLDCV